MHHPCWICLKCLGARFHCFGSFLLISYPSFQIMPQQEQSGVPKAKKIRKAPLSRAATSEAAFINLRKMESWVNFNRTAGNRIWTIYTNELTISHDRFDGHEAYRGQLEVRLISDKVYCRVQFRNTPDTKDDKNLLSTVDLPFSSSIDRQVSRLFNLLSVIDWKNWIFYCSSITL